MNNYLTEFSAVIPANAPVEATTKLRDLIKSGSIAIATARGDQEGDPLMEVDLAENTVTPIEE